MKKLLKTFIVSIFFVFSFFTLFVDDTYAQVTDNEKMERSINEKANAIKITPNTASKEVNSWTYTAYAKLLRKTREFATQVSHRLSGLLVKISAWLFVIYLGFLFIQAVLKQESFTTVLSKNLGYLAWIVAIVVLLSEYEYLTALFFKLFTGIAGEILKISTQDLDVLKRTTESGLKNAFLFGERISVGIDMIAHTYAKEQSTFWSLKNSFLIDLQAFGMKVAFYMVSAAFMIIFSVASLSMVIFFAIGKPLLLLAVFPKLRYLLVGWLEALVNFGFTLIFLSIAMGLTVFTISDTFIAYEGMIANQEPLPPETFIQLTFVGILSFFFHISASVMASMVTKAHVQDFGRTFATTAGMAWAGGKALAQSDGAKALIAAGGTAIASSGTAISSGGNKAKSVVQNLWPSQNT